MVYAASKDALRKRLVGVSVEIQATDADELDHDTILSKLQK
jgi:cofilin